MDKITRGIETRYRDIRSAVRHFPSGLPVRAIGYFPAKRDWVRRTFQRVSFMFVLRGDGEYRWGERRWTFEGPCAFVGYPGVYVEYGPTEEWEELYINYVPELSAAIETRRLLSRERPFWPIHDAGAIRRRAAELLDALNDVDSFGCVDRIDRLSEGVILESLISAASPPLGERDRAIMAIRAHLEQHYREAVDFDQLALANGLSPSDFRRKWGALMRVTPGRFVTQLRMREACRLLVETDKTIREIAATVGYSDPLYFSRRFRQIVGETATSYRGMSLRTS